MYYLVKPFAIVFLFAFLLGNLSSCGIIIRRDPSSTESESLTQTNSTKSDIGTSAPSTTTVKKPQTQKVDNKEIAKKYLDALVKKDFGGLGVTIATNDLATFAPLEADTPMKAARLERNHAVEKKYNTHILTKQTSITDMAKEALQSHLAGMYYADLLAIPMNWMGYFQTQGMLMNMRSLPFTDFSAPYYEKKGIQQLSAGYCIYGAIGAANMNLDYLYTLYFNKNLIQQYHLENPYDLVYSGKWTWEKFGQMIKAVAIDINGQPTGIAGQSSAKNDSLYTDILYASINEPYVTTGLYRVPEVSYMNDRTRTVIGYMRDFIYNKNTMLTVDESTANSALNSFCSGNLLFYTDRFYISTWMKNESVDWGILPFPKLDVAQKTYSTYCDLGMPVLSVLASNPETENTGLLLQALNAASYGYINDAYYTELMNYVLRDNDSLNMLEYICNNPSFDFALMFGSGYEQLAAGTYYSMHVTAPSAMSLDDLYNTHAEKMQTVLQTKFPLSN